MAYEIEYRCVSHIGKIRRQNQDNFVCLNAMQHYTAKGTEQEIRGLAHTEKGATFAVFDGMGGEECGEMAAYIAAETLANGHLGLGGTQNMTDYCSLANRKICGYADTHKISSMGTTAAILHFVEDTIWLCNIGDSKVFVLSPHQFRQISQDHVSTPIYGRKPPLSQNLGIPESELLLEPYIACGECSDSIRYLICSDGLTDMVSNERIEEILRNTADEAVGDALLREALNNGGRDNITFILLRVRKRQRSVLDRILGRK